MKRIVFYNDEIHIDGPVEVGEVLEAIRGNGPREGASMGLVTISECAEDRRCLGFRFHGTEAVSP